MPFDLKKIFEQLESGRGAEEGMPAWLAESWKDPDGFHSTLALAHVGRGPPLKSRTGQHYDFFQDLIVRHGTSDRIALRTYDRVRGWQVLSYRQLHEQAARRAASWALQGVQPGAKVCLLYNLGPELLISLAAALGLGTCISLLPPQGWSFVARRLAALGPDHVAAEPHQAPLLGSFDKVLLRNHGSASPAFTSHTYKPAEPVGLLFSPLADPLDTPVPLSADDAWRGALVDGLLTFGLNAGDHLAAPGFFPLQHLPALLLTTLLRNATLLHLELADLKQDPKLLLAHRLRALGVSSELRDLLLGSRLSLKNVSHWFRNPEEPLDWQAWRSWVKQCALSSAPCSNVLVDPAAGGAVLCSQRRVGDIHMEAPPAPGRQWELQDLNQSGQQAAMDVGLFSLLPAKGRPPPYVILSRVRGQYLYAGTLTPRREGRLYPSAEVTETLEGLPPLCGTSILPLPSGGTAGHYRYVLLAFTGHAKGLPPEQEIRRRIELQLGPEYLPDRIEPVPLFPRRKKGKVDDAWCHSQYLTGALFQKSSDPMFQALTALRGHILAREARAGDDAPASTS